MLRGRFPPGPSRLVGPPMPTPGPTWAPSAGGRGRTVFAAENPLPGNTGSAAPSSAGGSALGAPVRDTAGDTACAGSEPTSRQNPVSEPPPAEQPSLGRAVATLETPPEACPPCPAPGLGRTQGWARGSRGRPRPGRGSAAPAGHLASGPARSRQKGGGGDPRPPKPTPGATENAGQTAEQLPAAPVAGASGSALRSFSRGDRPRQPSGRLSVREVLLTTSRG